MQTLISPKSRKIFVCVCVCDFLTKNQQFSVGTWLSLLKG